MLNLFYYYDFLWGGRHPFLQPYIEVGQTEAPAPGESSAWNEQRHQSHPYRFFLRDPSRGDVGQESGGTFQIEP
jgi:hypothetical protein